MLFWILDSKTEAVLVLVLYSHPKTPIQVSFYSMSTLTVIMKLMNIFGLTPILQDVNQSQSKGRTKVWCISSIRPKVDTDRK